ncbi:Integral membrane Yip1 family protein [Perilla frutescens var. hirtella]|nr:Integral membrane Yip1 family protein [Perilla frutescens var. frutescens]KAH6787874.1 Integral membrane Yip1 family protein [Perilla frutescens var. hirtella]
MALALMLRAVEASRWKWRWQEMCGYLHRQLHFYRQSKCCRICSGSLRSTISCCRKIYRFQTFPPSGAQGKISGAA